MLDPNQPLSLKTRYRNLNFAYMPATGYWMCLSNKYSVILGYIIWDTTCGMWFFSPEPDIWVDGEGISHIADFISSLPARD